MRPIIVSDQEGVLTVCMLAEERRIDPDLDRIPYCLMLQPPGREGRSGAETGGMIGRRPSKDDACLVRAASRDSRPGTASRLAAAPRTPPVFASTSPFADIGPAATVALNRVSVRRQFAGNELIYIQDDEATHLNIVLSGHVRLSYLMEDGSAVLHSIVPPGESFGELGVFENGTYADMASAAGPLVLASIPTPAFRQLCQAHPTLFEGLGRAVARRYRSYITMTRDLSLKSLPARLAQAVLRLADGLGRKVVYRGRPVDCIGAVVTQTDLGLMSRGSRGNVNRALKAWERAAWIAVDERRIMILDRPALESLSIEEA